MPLPSDGLPAPEWIANRRARLLWQRRAGRDGTRAPEATFDGRRVLTLESRRAPELALLVMNYGGVPMVAPAMREVPLDSNTEASAFARALVRGEVDIVVLMTGVGTRLMLDIAGRACGREPFLDALRTVRLVARGPKSVAALREVGITPWIAAPKPNTWREVLSSIDAQETALVGARVAVQEYGASSPDVPEGLRARGAEVLVVPVYRWALPENLAPLQAAVTAILAGEIDSVIVTAPIQLLHLIDVASQMEVASELRGALGRSSSPPSGR